MVPDDLKSLKDDMVAYITVLGLHRFSGYVGEEMPSVMWAAPHETSPLAEERPEDGWKEFLELAKASGITFVTVFELSLSQDDLDELREGLDDSTNPDPDDREELINLKRHIGKIGSLQLGFAYQGTMFLYETTTGWYENYQMMQRSIEELTDMILDSIDEETTEED